MWIVDIEQDGDDQLDRAQNERMMDEYRKLKEKAQQRDEYSRWTFGPAVGGGK